jgi:hypothetical protein
MSEQPASLVPYFCLNNTRRAVSTHYDLATVLNKCVSLIYATTGSREYAFAIRSHCSYPERLTFG